MSAKSKNKKKIDEPPIKVEKPVQKPVVKSSLKKNLLIAGSGVALSALLAGISANKIRNQYREDLFRQYERQIDPNSRDTLNVWLPRGEGVERQFDADYVAPIPRHSYSVLSDRVSYPFGILRGDTPSGVFLDYRGSPPPVYI